MTARDDRLVQNQEMSRSANKRLQDVAARSDVDGRAIPFLCECADAECVGRVEMSIDAYFLAHLAPDHYVILAGHPRIDGEAVVDDRGYYQLVTKADT